MFFFFHSVQHGLSEKNSGQLQLHRFVNTGLGTLVKEIFEQLARDDNVIMVSKLVNRLLHHFSLADAVVINILSMVVEPIS